MHITGDSCNKIEFVSVTFMTMRSKGAQWSLNIQVMVNRFKRNIYIQLSYSNHFS